MWGPLPSGELLRRRPLRRLAAPFRERRFTYGAYAAFLERLAGCEVVPLREFSAARVGERAVVGLRHDIDAWLDSALVLARLEAERGLRATYFALHTAPYYRDAIPALKALQERGHEIGLHNDALSVAGDPGETLRRELERLREAGLEVVGVAGHGSRAAHERRLFGHQVFSGLPARPRFPNSAIAPREPDFPQVTLAELGLAYDADFLDNDRYYADSFYDERGRRWHPEELDADALGPGTKTIVLTHPCHWDEGLSAKLRRALRQD